MKNGSKIIIVFIVAIALFFVAAQKSNQPKAEWKAPATADTLKSLLVKNSIAIEKGKQLFIKTCVPCHGNTGKGDGVAGISLKPRPQDLTSLQVQSQTDGAIFWKITTGKAPMASYKVTLTDDQRWQLVGYVRKLKYQVK